MLPAFHPGRARFPPLTRKKRGHLGICTLMIGCCRPFMQGPGRKLPPRGPDRGGAAQASPGRGDGYLRVRTSSLDAPMGL